MPALSSSARHYRETDRSQKGIIIPPHGAGSASADPAFFVAAFAQQGISALLESTL